MWTCPKCAEEVDDEFEVCWACGTAPDGTEDPFFISADEVGPLDDPAEEGGLKPIDELTDEFGERLPELVDAYSADSVIEARFIADQLRSNGVPAVSETHNLNVEVFGGFTPTAWGAGPRVRVRPQDLVRARTWIETYLKRRRERRDSDE